MNHLRYWTGLWTLLLAFTLCGCQEDDVMEIFTSRGTWYWSTSADTSDWENDNAKTRVTLSPEEQRQIRNAKDSYYIRFLDDGTIEGKGQSFTFTGQWSANPDDRSVSIRINTDRDPSGMLDKRFLNELKNARHYRGNSLMLKLGNAEKDHFIQISHVKNNEIQE